jgi:hypothetical protein
MMTELNQITTHFLFLMKTGCAQKKIYLHMRHSFIFRCFILFEN